MNELMILITTPEHTNNTTERECIKHPDDIDRIEKLTNCTIEHNIDVKSATPKNFVRRLDQMPHEDHFRFRSIK